MPPPGDHRGLFSCRSGCNQRLRSCLAPPGSGGSIRRLAPLLLPNQQCPCPVATAYWRPVSADRRPKKRGPRRHTTGGRRGAQSTSLFYDAQVICRKGRQVRQKGQDPTRRGIRADARALFEPPPVRSAAFASRVEPDVTNSSVKRGQKDCGDDHAVRCQDQPKATRLCINPG